MTMAAEIKNRVGPPAAAQPGAAGDINFCISVSVFSSPFVYMISILRTVLNPLPLREVARGGYF